MKLKSGIYFESKLFCERFKSNTNNLWFVAFFTSVYKWLFLVQIYNSDNHKMVLDFAGRIIQFVNCRILYKGELIREDLWVRDGIILNPEKVFYTEREAAYLKIDCKNLIISPGFIDVQINGILFEFQSQHLPEFLSLLLLFKTSWAFPNHFIVGNHLYII